MADIYDMGGNQFVKKITREYEEKLQAANNVASEYKRLYELSKQNQNSVDGVNNLLKLQLADLETTVKIAIDRLRDAEKSIAELKSKLPE